MGNSKRPHVATMLEKTRSTLDRIFGAGKFTIERTGEYSALLTTEFANLQFTDDPRDSVAASIVDVPGIDVVQSPIDTWMEFLGEDIAPQKRTEPYEEQLATQLKWIALIVERILSARDTTRDAASFVAGYNRAYNDWASRKGSWTSPDFKD